MKPKLYIINNGLKDLRGHYHEIRQWMDLAVAVGLQGRVAEAETIVKAGVPEDQAAANAAYLKRLLSRKENAQASVDRKPARGAGRSE